MLCLSAEKFDLLIRDPHIAVGAGINLTPAIIGFEFLHQSALTLRRAEHDGLRAAPIQRRAVRF